MSHPYEAFLRSFSTALEGARRLPLGGLAPLSAAPRRADAPRTLIFAPHPDDECIVGGLPLRLQRELGHAVGVVPVTAGSREDRRAPRLEELAGACGFLGWDVVPPGEGLAAIVKREKPVLVLVPHARDANSTHRRVHVQVLAALKEAGYRGLVAETEFWSTLEDPNLMVESSEREAADLVAALSFHVGEVSRNPYHALLPCFMADAVRRGGELVGAQGGKAPDFRFATLYRLSRFDGAALAPLPARSIAAGGGLAALF